MVAISTNKNEEKVLNSCAGRNADDSASKRSQNSTCTSKPKPPPAVVEAQSREPTASVSHPWSPMGAASGMYKTFWNDQAVAAAKAALSSLTYAGPGGGDGNQIDVRDDDIGNSYANNSSPESKASAGEVSSPASIGLPTSPPIMSSLSMHPIGDESSYRGNHHRQVDLKKDGEKKCEEDKKFLQSCLKKICLTIVFVAIGIAAGILVMMLANGGIRPFASKLEEPETSQQDQSSNAEEPTRKPTFSLAWTAKAKERGFDPETNANRLEVDGSGQTGPTDMPSQLPTTSAPSASAFTHTPSFLPTAPPVSVSPSKPPSAPPISVSLFRSVPNLSSCSGLSSEQYYRSHLEEGIDEATLSYLKSLDIFNLSWRIKVELSRTNSQEVVETFGPENQFSSQVRMAAIRTLLFWTRRGSDDAFFDTERDTDMPRHVKIVGTHSSDVDGLVELGLAFVSLHGMTAEEGIEEAKRAIEVIEANVPRGFENPIFSMHGFAYDMFGEAGVLIGDGMLEYLRNICTLSEVPFEMALHGRLAAIVGTQLLHLNLGMPIILPSEDADDTYQTLFADALGAYYMAHPLGGMLTGDEVFGPFLGYARSTGADVCESSSPTISRPSTFKQLSSSQKECATIWATRWAWMDDATAKSRVANLLELKDRFDARYEQILNVDKLATCP